MMAYPMPGGPPNENGPGRETGAACEKECGRRSYAASLTMFESTGGNHG